MAKKVEGYIKLQIPAGKATTSPLSAVFALNCFVNSTIFTPCCPSAGPTGGAGVALPAAICNLIYPSTFLAIMAPPNNVVISEEIVQLCWNQVKNPI